MRHVAWLTRKVCVPVIREFIERRDGVATGIVWIFGSRPRVLKYNLKCQPNISLVNSLNCVHDSVDVIIRGARTSQSRDVVKVEHGRALNRPEWRKDLRLHLRG